MTEGSAIVVLSVLMVFIGHDMVVMNHGTVSVFPAKVADGVTIVVLEH